MTHLRIEQQGTELNVSPSVISKLYQEAYIDAAHKNPNCILSGDISTPHAKESVKNWFNTMYSPNFSITVTDGYYMDFADSEVERICVANWGSDGGITQAQAAAVTQSLWTEFTGNTLITSFDEFKYFNFGGFNWAWGDTQGFSYCTNLTSIDLGGKTYNIGRAIFEGCTSLVSVKNWNGTQLGVSAFGQCSNLTTINLSNVTKLDERTFAGCTSLDVTANGLDFTKLDRPAGGSYSNCFNGVLGVGDVRLSTLWKGSLYNTFRNCPSITSISNCPSISDFGNHNNDWSASWSNCTVLDKIDFSDSTLVMQIKRGMVGNCPVLRIIKFPNSITSIYKNWLSDSCPNLKAVVFNSTTPPTWEDGNFFGTYDMLSKVHSSFKIYVPNSADDTVLNAYKAASGWSDYSSRIYSMSQFAIDFPND